MVGRLTTVTTDGLSCWSMRVRDQWVTVGLVVRDGVIVDCPPYARRWAHGRDAREVWRARHRAGADLVSLPDE